MKKTLLPVAALLGALLLTSCGDQETTATDPAARADGRFNDADVAFAQGMIPHHEQAVAMAEVAGERARTSEVRDLAARIEAAQAPEIEQMTAWLEDWDAEVPSGDMPHGDMGHGDPGSHMSGMMTAGQMRRFHGAAARDIDRMFLTMMIQHHRGAVAMAETEVTEGESPDATALAEEIITAQEAEIEEMETLLRR